MAVIDELKGRGDAEILYIGSRDGIEKVLCEKFGVPYKGISCGKLRRYFSWENFRDFFRVPVGVFQAYRIIKKFGADAIFSKGGFVSLPVAVAGRFLGVPVIVHESDVSPGLANKIAFKMASKICISFEETKKYLSESALKKAVFTGNPLREFNGSFERGLKFTGFNKFRPIILVMGGSQGAQQINALVRESLDELLKKFQIVHIVGKGNLDISVKEKGYKQYEYLDEQLADIYAISEMVISRGGANALAELAMMRKKVLVIPLGQEGSRGEQFLNAQVFGRLFGWPILSGKIKTKDFVNNVMMAFNHQINSGAKFKNGLKAVVDVIVKLAK